VPPEFRPSERSKKKTEPLKPKEPKTIDDIVDDIMRDYRDKQRELGNVDNWGQPKEKLDKRKVEKWVRKNLPKLQGDEGEVKKKGKKRFFPSAPEGLSEAIGNKLKGKGSEKKTNRRHQGVQRLQRPPKYPNRESLILHQKRRNLLNQSHLLRGNPDQSQKHLHSVKRQGTNQISERNLKPLLPRNQSSHQENGRPPKTRKVRSD